MLRLLLALGSYYSPALSVDGFVKLEFRKLAPHGEAGRSEPLQYLANPVSARTLAALALNPPKP